MGEEKKGVALNLNTVLLAVVLGVMSWIGVTVTSNASDMAALKVDLRHYAEGANARNVRLTELEARVNATNVEVVRLRADLMRLEEGVRRREER